MKTYPQDIISKLQEAINNNSIEVEQLESPEDFPTQMMTNGIQLNLIDDGSRKDSYIFTEDFIDKIDGKAWKLESLGRFVAKDWKSYNAGKEPHALYKLITFHFGEFDIEALVRDITDEEIQEVEEQPVKEDYQELLLNDRFFTIIKAHIVEYEEWKKQSELEVAKTKFEKPIGQYGAILQTEVEDDLLEESNIEDESSIELF